MIFREWDYDAGTVVTYNRMGDCNNCGQCCLNVIRFMAYNNTIRGYNESVRWDAHNGEPVKAMRGRFIEVEHNNKHRYFYNLQVLDEKVRCPSLTDDNKCMIHAGKPLLHRAWPMIPAHVEAFDQCSYTFQETERRAIREGE